MAVPESEETDLPQIINLSQVTVENVQAELVRASQVMVQNLNAEEVDLQTSIIGVIQTGDLQAHDSFLGTIGCQQASVQDSLVGGLRAETLSFNGVSALAVANNMSNKELNTLAVVSTNVQADNIHTGILISREVHGNVTTTLDGRTAMMAGLVGGAVTGLILLAGKILFNRKK